MSSTIALRNIVPGPLQGHSFHVHSIWNRNVTISTSDRINVVAISGAGKSSLLHFLTGWRADYAGEILVDDQDIRQRSLDDWAKYRRNEVSVVYQDLRLFDQLTARENVLLSCEIAGFDPAPLEELARRMHVYRELDQKAGTLSMGQQQRIAIIRALLRPFKWLLLDEPFSHIDADNTQEAAQLIRETCAKRDAGWLHTSLSKDTPLPYEQILHI